MLTGKVKWFNNTKGFGFIECGGKDYFVHFSDIVGKGFKSLTRDAIVTFKPESGSKGLVATNVAVDAFGGLL